MSYRRALHQATRRARGDALVSVPVKVRGADLPDFAPGDFVDRRHRPWDVESLWLAAARYARHHSLPDAVARAAWLAYASAHDRATGLAVELPGGFAHYSPRSLRHRELKMRHAGNDPEAAAFAALDAEDGRTDPA